VPWPRPGTGGPHGTSARSFLLLPIQLLLPLRVLTALAVASPHEERDHNFVWVFIALAALCVGQVFTLRDDLVDLRYTYQSFLLLIAFVAILARIAWQSLALAPLRPRRGCRGFVESRCQG